jgi:uncharacterized protein YndB with AHSA1/START domain
MAHASHTVVVDRPIADVFEFLADATHELLWRPDVISISLVSGSGLGAQYAQTMKGPGGRPIAGDFRYTRFDVPKRIDFEVTAGPARPTGSFALRDLSADSTEVTYTMDLEPQGFLRLLSSMIDKQVRAEVAHLDKLPAAMGR